MCGPKFCSMRISHDIRKTAKEDGVAEEDLIEKGMQEKAIEFVEAGSKIYK